MTEQHPAAKPLIVEYAKPEATKLPPIQLPMPFKNAHERSLATRSKRIDDTRFSQRVRGLDLTTGGTIRNTRARIGRNRRVSVAGDPVVKMKRSVLARQPLPFGVH